MKRGILILVTVVAVIGGLVLGLLKVAEWKGRKHEQSWHDFVEHWEARGESFRIVPGVQLSDEDEFIKHPWVQRLIAGDPVIVERLERMDPSHLEGYGEWQDDVDPDGKTRPMSLELARRIRDHGTEFKTELDAFIEAAGRRGLFLGDSQPGITPSHSEWLGKIGQMTNLIGALADAAAVNEDWQEFSRHVDVLLGFGNRLRANGDTFALIVGCGLELEAYEALQNLQNPANCPEGEKIKWIEFLDGRKRSPADEWAAVLRLHRNSGLVWLERAERDPGLMSNLSRLQFVRRGQMARLKLLSCELLQKVVFAPTGSVGPVKEEDMIRFEREVERIIRDDPKSEMALVLSPQIAINGIYSSLMEAENERVAARNHLRAEGISRK